MGSGTTAVAAEMLGRQWIGIELSQKYCDNANQRLRNAFAPEAGEIRTRFAAEIVAMSRACAPGTW